MTALDNATLEIPRGDFVSVVGPSGSGKSTLLLMLGGMLSPSAGPRAAGGQVGLRPEPERAGRLRREKVGFVFQTFNLVPYLSALENVQVPLFLAKMDENAQKQRAAALLERVGLGDRLRPQTGRIERRPAAARGPGPDAGQRSGRHPGRRADRQPRPGNQPADHSRVCQPETRRNGGGPWMRRRAGRVSGGGTGWPTGKAIGIDMTPEMLELARSNAAKGDGGRPITNVEFHQATIDKLPLPDASVDCVISNCVINLAPDKPAVFREIVRVLKPGGRLAVSDIALKKPLPPEVGNDLMAYVGCIAGAIPIEQYRSQLVEAGFAQADIIDTGSDLNAYAKVENQSGCCSPTMGSSLPMVSASCCSASPSDEADLHQQLADLLRRYNVNDYAASVRVYAVKPASVGDGQPPPRSQSSSAKMAR